MIKIGDRVRFLNDVGGGIVKGFISKNLVNVENDDGFEIPTLISEIVVIREENGKKSVEPLTTGSVSTVDREKKAKGKTIRQPIIIEGKNEPAFYFAFVPENPSNPVGGNINAYFVNDSNFSVIYHFSHETESGYETIKTGRADPNSKTKLESIVQSDFNNLPHFGFQLIPYLEKGGDRISTVSKSFHVNPVKFYKESSFRPNPFFNGNAILYEISGNIMKTELDKLTNSDLQEVVRQKQQESTALNSPGPKPSAPDIKEVDLHIHQLVDSTAGLENRDIIEIQMKKFHNEMDQAIKTGGKRIVFIHGIGQGTLKNEIRKELSTRYKKYYFQDASFREYGFGATMVIIRK